MTKSNISSPELGDATLNAAGCHHARRAADNKLLRDKDGRLAIASQGTPSSLMLDIYFHALVLRPSNRMLLFFLGAVCNHSLNSIRFGRTSLHKCSKPASYASEVCNIDYRSDLASHTQICFWRPPIPGPPSSLQHPHGVLGTDPSIDHHAEIGVMHNSGPIPADAQIPSR